MDGDTARRISMDLSLGITPGDSTITYGPEELAFRDKLITERAEILAKNPDAIFDVRE